MNSRCMSVERLDIEGFFDRYFDPQSAINTLLGIQVKEEAAA